MDTSWEEVHRAAYDLAGRWRHTTLAGVYGVPRGGIPVALMVSRLLDVPMLDSPVDHCLVVDDLVDSGATLRRYSPKYPVDALYRKPVSPNDVAPDAWQREGWIVFPWEGGEQSPTDSVVRLLQYLGEDPSREGLTDTPLRVVKALKELTVGYDMDPATILGTTFDVKHDQMIHVKNIGVVSMCEHHMLPFTGTAHVAYVPSDRVVGLSKIPRVVQAFARRLQVQERLTDQIADAIEQNLNPRGVGVKIVAHHQCMGLRGVMQPDATMTTTALRGVMFESGPRSEFLRG